MPADPQRVKQLFVMALDHSDRAERDGFLARECEGDADLRRRLDALLEAHDHPKSALERPLGTPAQTADYAGPTETVGTLVAGRYKLLETIGEGGMGEVWVADQLEPIRRRVALKLIKPGMDSRAVLARFEAERQALALMDHPNIAKVLDAGTTDDGRPYFVMELVKGTPITQFCDARKLSPRERLELFISVCQAIQHAHQKGIIHRDIKPTNVLVALHDEKAVPKVIDFGVAKAIGQQLTEKTLYTGFGALIGTPAYMAPEQATFNQLDVDTRADVYALGVLLYELLAGSPPFEPERLKKAALDEVLRLVREEEPQRPSARYSTSETKASIAAVRHSDPAKLAKLLRGELDCVVMKALEKDRSRRYETANGFAADVQRYLAGEAVLAVPPSAGYRLRKFARRNKAGLVTSLLVATALLVGTVVSTWQAVQVSRAKTAEGQALGAQLRAEVDRADAEQARADEAQRRALAQQGWRHTAYNLQIALVFNEVGENNLVRAEKLLEECPTDLRNWEWRYLRRLCHSELSSIALGAGRFSKAVFSPDRRYVAQLSQNRETIRLCDAETGKELHSFATPGFPRVAAFSPDGARLAAPSSDDNMASVQVWDTSSGKETGVLTVNLAKRPVGSRRSELSGLAFGPDGRTVAATDDQGGLYLWNLAAKEPQHPVATHVIRNPKPGETSFAKVAFGPDGTWLATACPGERGVKLWNAETGAQVRSLSQHEPGNGFVEIAISPRGTWVGAVAATRPKGVLDPSVWVWDATTGQMKFVFDNIKRAGCLAFSPDEKQLAVAGEGGALTVWDIQSGKKTATYRSPSTGVFAITYSRDGKRLFSLGYDGTIRVWDAERSPEALVVTAGIGGWHAALSTDGRTLASASIADGVFVWDANSGKQLRRFEGNSSTLMTAFSPDGALIAAALTGPGAGIGSVRIWESKTGQLLRTLPDPAQGPGPPTAAVAFSPDGTRLAAGGLDRAVRVWDVAAGTELVRLSGHSRSVTAVQFSRDGQRLLSATGGHNFLVNSRDKNPLKLVGDWDQFIPDLKVWDLNTSREILSLSLPDKTLGAAISPDGRVVAAAFRDNTVRLYLVESGRELMVLKGHSGPVWGIAFSPDGNRIVTGGADEQVKLWNAQTGEEILTPGRVSGMIFSVGFSGDGHKIVSASSEEVRVWDATPLKE